MNSNLYIYIKIIFFSIFTDECRTREDKRRKIGLTSKNVSPISHTIYINFSSEIRYPFQRFLNSHHISNRKQHHIF